MRFTSLAAAAAALGMLALPALGAISAEEAAKLGGPELNEAGALRAANKDGSIPAYGGKPMPQAAPPATAGKFQYGDAYANEKPLYSIDAKNMGQYADKLSEGTKALMAKYPTFRIDVYPTKRDLYFPRHVLENTKKCAQTAKLEAGGDGLTGASACIPFPIPKSGYEAMWNATLRVGRSPIEQMEFRGWLVDSAGNHTMNSHNALLSSSDFNDPGKSNPVYANKLLNENLGPAAKAGTKDLRWTPLRMDQEEPRAWSYIAGQRRVRLAPEFKYDTVSTSTGGLIVFDEINLFDGKFDRFDFSRVTLKEVIVPFNTQRTQYLPVAELDLKNHPNPDHVRWELRRVWQVDAPLKEGQRHVYKRKVFYIDQDSWAFLLYDSFDQGNKIYRTGMTFPFARTDIPVVNAQSLAMWDLTKDVWGWALHYHNGFIRPSTKQVEGIMTPDALAGAGIR